MRFESGDAAFDEIIEELFTKFVPEMFDGVQFWSIRWQGQQANIVWNLQVVTPMPTCAVHDHDDFLARMAQSDFVQKDLHAIGVGIRQDQGIEMTVANIDRSVTIMDEEQKRAERRGAWEQALASTRLEGHVPTPEFLADVEAEIEGKMTGDEVRARSLARAGRRPGGARVGQEQGRVSFVGPYLYLGAKTLRNKAEIHDEQVLRRFEYEQTGVRIRELRQRPIVGKFDLEHLKAIHAYIFQDVGQQKQQKESSKRGQCHLVFPCCVSMNSLLKNSK
jgi:hypothetical protein